MKRYSAPVLFLVALAVAVGWLVRYHRDANPSGDKSHGALVNPRPRIPSDRSHRHKLVIDANGNLVSIQSFERKLNLDDTYAKETRDFQLRLFVNYIELAIQANPSQALDFLRREQSQWVGERGIAPQIMKLVATTFGLEATKEFLDVIPFPDVLGDVVTGLSRGLKGNDPLAFVDYFLGYNPKLLTNEAVMANLMLQTEGGIDRLAELYLKLPQCKERVAAVRVLATKASSLNKEDFRKFYAGITSHLSTSEIREMHNKLTEAMESLHDPKLTILLANGYQGLPETLAKLATTSADYNLDDALRSLRSFDINPIDRNAIFTGIMRSWAQYAPKKAAQYAFSSYQSGDANEEGMNVVFGEWIKRDTSEAVNYFTRLDLDSQTKRMLDLNNFPNVASFSMEHGIAMMQARQNDPDYPPLMVDQMRRDFALSDSAHHSSQVVLGELAKIQDPGIKESALFRFSSTLASENLFKAVNLAAQTTVPSQRDGLLLGALAPAISYDIHYSHEMIRHINDSQKRDSAYMQWYDTARKTEPHLAADWLRGLEKSNPSLYGKLYK
jgi:hypothetical protein